MRMLGLGVRVATFIMASAASAADRPVLVELFTSQSCSSCPPADEKLAELATRPDVLALAYHVDYWNGLGWRDPLSLPEATERQRAYAAKLGGGVYTPELVVEGRAQAVGSDRSTVDRLINGAQRGVADAGASLRREKGEFLIHVGAGSRPRGIAQVMLVTYAPRSETVVRGGENAGRALVNVNAVRSLRSVGTWNGEAFDLRIASRAGDAGARAAIFVQDADGIIHAVALETESS